MVSTKLKPATLRQTQIVNSFLSELDKHIQEIRQGKAEGALEVREMADRVHVHPTHLSNTISQALGKSPCDIYEERLIALAKELLLTTPKSIAEIAHQMTYDPSNFTKFFKHFEGVTPKQFRTMNS